SDSELQLAVPNTIALGTAKISVFRDVFFSGKDIRQSNIVQYPLTGGFTLVPQRFLDRVSVFDNRPKVPDANDPTKNQDNPNFNHRIAAVRVTGGFPQYVATTPDNTRAYVTTSSGVSVVDTVAMQQVAQIKLTGNANPIPLEIAIDHEGKFAYVTDEDSPTV